MSTLNDGFNYVIARRWSEESKSLQIFAMQLNILWGNEEEAIQTRNLIRGRTHENDFEIYLVNPKPFKPSR